MSKPLIFLEVKLFLTHPWFIDHGIINEDDIKES